MHAIIAGRYQILEYLGSAAFSRAVQCVDLKNGQLVCVKIIRNNKDFFDQGLDEIKLLQYINSAGDADECCVLQLYDYFYHKEHLFLVCELLRDNLYEFSKYNRESGDEPYFTIPRMQRITKQVLTALKFIHRLNLIHCDLKPENILIKSYSRCEVKVIDFGSTCFTTDHLSSYVQSRCYRAPEVILGLPYSQKIDMWSLGAILPELYNGRVIFHNDSIQTMMARIMSICGPIPTHMMQSGRYVNRFFTKQGALYERNKQTGQLTFLQPKRCQLRHRIGSDDELFIDFVNCLLQIDPAKRPTAAEALRHPWLQHDYGPIN
jgi:serine/threonine protein kinase